MSEVVRQLPIREVAQRAGLTTSRIRSIDVCRMFDERVLPLRDHTAAASATARRRARARASTLA